MQVIITALCTPGTSLRQAIAKDSRLEEYLLVIDTQQEPDRKPGWLKLHHRGRFVKALRPGKGRGRSCVQPAVERGRR